VRLSGHHGLVTLKKKIAISYEKVPGPCYRVTWFIILHTVTGRKFSVTFRTRRGYIICNIIIGPVLYCMILRRKNWNNKTENVNIIVGTT